jgi:GT2 family glycosyltransferase
LFVAPDAHPLISNDYTFAVMEQPTINIIIVNWNSGELIRTCLQSIRQASAGLKVKTIVVDNGSRDGSADLIEREFPEVLLIRSGRNLGFGRGNNLAQPHIAPGYVLFLNPDTDLNPDALRQMCEFLESHAAVGAVGCKMVFPGGEIADQNLQWFPTPFTEFIRIAFLTYGMIRRLEGVLPWNDPGKSGAVQKLYGGCFLTRTSVLEKVGWFDERFFMYAEDVDLSRRIRDAGWQLFYLSEAQIMHVAGGASKGVGNGFSTLMSCASMEKLIEKYQGAFAGRLYRVAVFSASMIRLAFCLPAMIISALLRSRRSLSFRDAVATCLLRMKWVLGLRSVFIPE